jgi:hypothetical protein
LAGAAMVGYRAAARAGNEAATIQNLKTIAIVEVEYFNAHNATFGTFDELVSEQFLSAKFSGRRTVTDGYVFTLWVARKPDASSWYRINADPQDESTGTSHFYVDSNDTQIRVNTERQAGPNDPSV